MPNILKYCILPLWEAQVSTAVSPKMLGHQLPAPLFCLCPPLALGPFAVNLTCRRRAPSLYQSVFTTPPAPCWRSSWMFWLLTKCVSEVPATSSGRCGSRMYPSNARPARTPRSHFPHPQMQACVQHDSCPHTDSWGRARLFQVGRHEEKRVHPLSSGV